MNEDIKAFLIHSYLYYKLDSPVISDKEYDDLCKKLLAEGVQHDLFNEKDLKAGSGFRISEYPSEIITQAKTLLTQHEAKPIEEPNRAKEQFAPFEFNYAPGETWILLALYQEYKHYKMTDKMKEVQAELKSRWEAELFRDEFEAYFRDHQVNKELFGLD